jgi:hypothetical protein
MFYVQAPLEAIFHLQTRHIAEHAEQLNESR